MNTGMLVKTNYTIPDATPLRVTKNNKNIWDWKYPEIDDNKVMGHKEVAKWVHTGLNTEGINHFYLGNNVEPHGATCLFYKSLHTFGMKFLPPVWD